MQFPLSENLITRKQVELKSQFNQMFLLQRTVRAGVHPRCILTIELSKCFPEMSF